MYHYIYIYIYIYVYIYIYIYIYIIFSVLHIFDYNIYTNYLFYYHLLTYMITTWCQIFSCKRIFLCILLSIDVYWYLGQVLLLSNFHHPFSFHLMNYLPLCDKVWKYLLVCVMNFSFFPSSELLTWYIWHMNLFHLSIIHLSLIYKRDRHKWNICGLHFLK